MVQSVACALVTSKLQIIVSHSMAGFMELIWLRNASVLSTESSKTLLNMFAAQHSVGKTQVVSCEISVSL